MITVKSQNSKQYLGLEEKKQITQQKSDCNITKYLQSPHFSSPQLRNSQSKEIYLGKKIQQFQNTLLSVKGSDVISQSQHPLNSHMAKIQTSQQMSQFSTNIQSNLTTSGGLGGRNRYDKEDQINQKRLRKIVKNFQGKRIDNQNFGLPSVIDNVFQSVYNSDYHKNFINNSALTGQKQTLKDTPISQLKSFIGLQDVIYNNDDISMTQVKQSLNQLKQSIHTNTYDQVVDNLLLSKKIPKRSHSNNILKKNYLNPLRREEQTSFIDKKTKMNSSTLVQKSKEKLRSMSQEVVQQKGKVNPIGLSQLEKQCQEMNDKEGDDFDNLLFEIKREEDKYSPINNEDVITEYQLTMNSIKNLNQDNSQLTQINKSQSESEIQPALTHEQDIIQQLILAQPQYFDHKAGRCLCSICSCGFCSIKCRQISQHLETNQKANWISTYRQQFGQKYGGLDSTRSVDQLNQLKMQYKSELDSCPELYTSIAKTDYQQRQSIEEPYKHLQKVYTENKAPFSHLSSYNSQFVNWGVQPFNMIKQSQQKTVLDKLPFNHLTTYEESFHKKCDTLPSQMIIPKNMNPLPNIGMFLGESTSRRQFNEKSNNFFQLPKKYQQTSAQIIPSYMGQFKTENSKAYEGNIEKCQAKEILRKQFLEKIQIKNKKNKDEQNSFYNQ